MSRMKGFFGTREFWRAALPLALPIALQNLLISSFGIVDNAMVGVLGTIPLSGVGMATQWTTLFNVAMFGFTSGAGVFFAQYWGVKDMGGVKNAFTLATLCAGVVALLFTLAACVFPEKVIWLFTKETQGAFIYGVDYLRVAGFSYLALALSNVLSGLMRSTETPKMPMYVSLLTVIMNAALNATFIFGLDMGVKGAAMATVISSWTGPILLYLLGIRYGYRKMLLMKLREAFSWPKGFVEKYFRISLPVFCNEFLWALGTMVLNMVYSNRDETFFAAITSARSIENIMYVFFVGMCHACAVIIGKHVGAHRLDDAMDDAKCFARVLPMVSISIGLVLIAVRWPLISTVFPKVSFETQSFICQILTIYGVEIGLRNIPYITIVGIFRAGGDTRSGLIYDMVNLWGLSIPVTFVLGTILKLPLIPVYAAMLFSEDTLKSIMCIRRLRSGKWLKPVTELQDSKGAV